MIKKTETDIREDIRSMEEEKEELRIQYEDDRTSDVYKYQLNRLNSKLEYAKTLID